MNALVSKMSLMAKMETARGTQEKSKQNNIESQKLAEADQKIRSLEENELQQRQASEQQIKSLQDELASVKQMLANEKQEVESLKRKRQEDSNSTGSKNKQADKSVEAVARMHARVS